MTRTALEGFSKTLLASDEVVVEAIADSMAVWRVLAPCAAWSGAEPGSALGEHVGFGFIHECGELGQSGTELVELAASPSS